MQLKTILNRVQKFKSFLYGSARWVNQAGQPAVEVELHARANSRAICSGCGRRRQGTIGARRGLAGQRVKCYGGPELKTDTSGRATVVSDSSNITVYVNGFEVYSGAVSRAP